MNPNPLLLNLTVEQRVLPVMTHHLQSRHVEMHHILQTAPLPLVQTTVEPQFVSMPQPCHRVPVVVQHVRVKGQQGIRLAFTDTWLHFHEQTGGVQVPLALMLPIVLHFQQESLPVLKFLSAVLRQADRGIALSTLLQVFTPSSGNKLVLVLQDRPSRYDCHCEHDQSHRRHRLLGEDHPYREQLQAEYLVREVYQKLAITAQLPLTEWTAMLATRRKLQHKNDEHEHDEIGHNSKHSQPECNSYYLWLEDDLGTDQLEAVRASHLNRTWLGSKYCQPQVMAQVQLGRTGQSSLSDRIAYYYSSRLLGLDIRLLAISIRYISLIRPGIGGFGCD